MEATGHEVGQYFEELMALTRLMEREGIEVPSGGAVNGGNGHFTKMNEIRPKDLERLRAEVGEYRRIVTMRFRERMRQVSEKVGRAGADGLEVSASMKLLTHAEELHRNGKMEEAFATLEASERLQGVTWTDYQEFNKLREDVVRKCAAIKLAGGDVAEAERLLTVSEHEMLKDSGNALHQARAVRRPGPTHGGHGAGHRGGHRFPGGAEGGQMDQGGDARLQPGRRAGQERLGAAERTYRDPGREVPAVGGARQDGAFRRGTVPAERWKARHHPGPGGPVAAHGRGLRLRGRFEMRSD